MSKTRRRLGVILFVSAATFIHSNSSLFCRLPFLRTVLKINPQSKPICYHGFRGILTQFGAATEYLEKGPVTEPDFWNQTNRVFGRSFWSFAFWFN